MLAEFAGAYYPSPTNKFTLTTKEIRVLNKAEDVLSAEPQDGYFALEDAEYEMVKKVVLKLAEGSNRATSAPVIEDLITGAVTDLPDPEKVTDIGKAQGGD
tara:strand:- start:5194 stop:5496 length:303 start_codon:yes stop_codon:yes gene_type:complete